MKSLIFYRHCMSRKIFCFFFFFFFTSCIISELAFSSPSNTGFPVKDVIKAIKSEIYKANQVTSKSGPPLKIDFVEIVLTAVTKYDGDGNLILEIPVVGNIVEAGIGAKLKNTQRIALKLKPLDTVVQLSGQTDLGLVPAIQSVKSALIEVASGRIKFELDEGLFEAECTVKKNVHGGINFLFIESGVQYENLAMQIIKFHFNSGK
jgi:hypothetical protein